SCRRSYVDAMVTWGTPLGCCRALMTRAPKGYPSRRFPRHELPLGEAVGPTGEPAYMPSLSDYNKRPSTRPRLARPNETQTEKRTVPRLSWCRRGSVCQSHNRDSSEG